MSGSHVPKGISHRLLAIDKPCTLRRVVVPDEERRWRRRPFGIRRGVRCVEDAVDEEPYVVRRTGMVDKNDVHPSMERD